MAASSILLLRADDCSQRFHTARVISRHLQCNRPWPLYTQKRTFGRLFDHLVGGHEQRGRNCEAERLGGPEVDDEFKFGRRLHW